MENARMIYLRPGNMFKEFVIENGRQEVTSTGRAAFRHAGDGTKTLKGCLAEASDEDRVNHSKKEHIVTHTIVQPGGPKAKRKDMLLSGGRLFYIVDTDDAGGLGISTIYYAEERRDAR